MKKYIYKIFIIILLITNLLISYCYADDIEIEENNTNEINYSIDTNSNTNNELNNINARAYVVIDRNSNKVIIGKNETQKKKMASTTKIMTATIILENCNLNETVTISKKAAGTGGSRLGLKTGDKITVNDLLYGLMLCSGNDAAVALAEYAGGNIENFAKMMNDKAKELNLTNTNFETPHGLDSENHYTTAYELAILTNYALNNSDFAKIVGTKYYNITINGYPKSIHNTNELLGVLNGVYGVKTGFTNGANRCLVTACKRNNLDIICVVLGCDTKNYRTKDSISLIEYTFENYDTLNVKEIINTDFENWKAKNINSFSFQKGITKDFNLILGELPYNITAIKKESLNSIHTEINCEKIFQAPVSSNSQLGEILLKDNIDTLLTIPIYLENTIEKKDLFYYFRNILFNYNNILSNLIQNKNYY